MQKSRYEEACANMFQVVDMAVREAKATSVHNATRGAFLEKAIRDLLQKKLAKKFTVSTGNIQVIGQESAQIDILVANTFEHHSLASTDDYLSVTPEAVVAIIESKTSINGKVKLKETLRQALSQVGLCDRRKVFLGLYIHQGPENLESNFQAVGKWVLEAISEVTQEAGVHAIDGLAIGADLFVRRWDNAQAEVGGAESGVAWHLYHIRSFALGYLIHNVMDFAQAFDAERAQMYFPISTGKESMRVASMSVDGRFHEFPWEER